ncbi:ATP-dependent DNA helicase RecG [Marinactinospora thermotolerans]|uniref:Probable DNA 3'-5' helicase RecG n=1 Tax=Marinactinospora thermotolerans DSM 45154 TaxID=1122192 RepID=A0A1T4SGG3_9ACTN|nr:ATP-dependent DNA helicase RecG [Marinactinospora thermotolerans]SKA27008.1 ATP-dependent DNA helicase RecG [Marinactinospora thermotolerans DSM 45154]
MDTDEPLRKTLGDRTAKKLATALDLHTVGDLLRHYPRRYATRGELTDLAGLAEGEQVTVMAEIARVGTRRMRNRRGGILEVVVTDGRGKLTLTFFNQQWRERELVPGRRGLFAGKVSSYRGQRQLAHPEYQLFAADAENSAEDQAKAFAEEIIPVYAASSDLASWKIAQCAGIVLDQLDEVADPLPPSVRSAHGLIGLREAYELIHRPASHADIARARKRLKWDEAFVLQVALASRRRDARSQAARPRPRRAGGLLDAFDAALPFTLTQGQREVGDVIAADLASPHPMHRLLQGDVGAGKTLVALRAMLQAVDAGGQAVLLAPTEVLAQQHHRSISAMLGPLARAGQIDGAEHATRIALLTGSQGAAARREALLEAASGAAGIVVGTHALLQEHVSFADLALIVIDEQHRFGVEQRDALREKATDGRPHVLVMTATPIPRTVAMTVYGDLDVVALRQLPDGRAPVATHLVPARDKPHYLSRAWERIREEVAQGRQAYVVCPRIGGGDEDAEVPVPSPEGDAGEGDAVRRPPLAVLDLVTELAEGPLADLEVQALHGRLAPEDKDAVMRGFAAGKIDVLVATTVIEVGVDVPNATVMAIMDADRFGVSQLHQLRGRVGRGGLPGLCLLVTDAEEGTPARERLAAVAATTDGFALSEVDLEQRHEGDVLGDAQSGRRSSLRMLTLLRDRELIGQAREEATAFVEADPELRSHPPLATALAELLTEERAEYLEKA